MTLQFRLLTNADFEQFARWLAKPHVQRWWREPATVEHIIKEYGPCVDGTEPTKMFVVQADGRDIGIIQSFETASYPQDFKDFPLPGAASIDYFIGEEDYVGRGVGTRMIGQFIKEVVRPTYPQATGVTTSVEVDNAASLSALRKNGFVPGNIITGDYGTPERVMTLTF